MEEIDKEISEMKISLNARARIVAEEFLKNVRPITITEKLQFFLFCSFEISSYISSHAMTNVVSSSVCILL